MRLESEEGTDAQSAKLDPLLSPGSTRRAREKKSIFKRHSKGKTTIVPELPKLSPRHHPDNTSEVSDDRSESPVPEEEKKEKKGKTVKKIKSFKKAAMKVKIGRKLISKGSSSEEREEAADATSLGLSEVGEEEGEGEGEGEGEEGVDRGEMESEVQEEGGRRHSNGDFRGSKTDLQSAPSRPESLGSQPPRHRAGTKLKKGSKSFRQDKQTLVTPSEPPKKSAAMTHERRTSAPGHFRVALGTPSATPGKILPGDHAANEAPLTPIVEISPPTVASDSVFSTEEDVFAVQGIQCCVWGQWMCVFNAGGHVMAFNFQMDTSVTVPKVHHIHVDTYSTCTCNIHVSV